MVYSEENYKNAKTNDVFEFVCKKCGEIFFKTKREISKNKGKIPVFCSQDCQKQYYKDDCYITVKCENCGKEKEILKGDYNKSKTKKFFCNHSCSAEYNNKIRGYNSSNLWIRKDENGKNQKRGYNKCPICGKLKNYKSLVCDDCRKKEQRNGFLERTLRSFIGEDMTYSTHKCGTIRKKSREILEESKVEKVCAYCKNHDFDDILEVHHIKGIMSFDRDTKMKEINSLPNLIWLCPNHHIMLEKGLIKLSDDMINKEIVE